MTELFAATAPVFKVDGTCQGELARDVSFLRDRGGDRRPQDAELRLIAEGPRPNETRRGAALSRRPDVDFGKEIEVSIGPSGRGAHHLQRHGQRHRGELQRRRRAARDGVRRRQADEAAHDAAHEDLREHERRRHRAGDRGGARPAGRRRAPTGPTYKVVQQWNQSDLAFLRERARLIQAEVWFDDDTLCFKTRGNRTGTTLTLVQGTRPDRGAAARRPRAPAHDGQGERLRRRAARRDRRGGGRGRDPGGDLRRPHRPRRAAAGVRRARRRIACASDPLVSGEAQRVGAGRDAAARARLRHRRRDDRRHADMVVGSKLTLDRVGAPFNGDGYYVTRVCHTYDLDDGYRTHFEAERPTVNEGGA